MQNTRRGTNSQTAKRRQYTSSIVGFFVSIQSIIILEALWTVSCNQMNTSQKQSVTVFLDASNEPVGLIYFSKDRERIIYSMQKADEEEIVNMFESKDPGRKISKQDKGQAK